MPTMRLLVAFALIASCCAIDFFGFARKTTGPPSQPGTTLKQTTGKKWVAKFHWFHRDSGKRNSTQNFPEDGSKAPGNTNASFGFARKPTEPPSQPGTTLKQTIWQKWAAKFHRFDWIFGGRNSELNLPEDGNEAPGNTKIDTNAFAIASFASSINSRNGRGLKTITSLPFSDFILKALLSDKKLVNAISSTLGSFEMPVENHDQDLDMLLRSAQAFKYRYNKAWLSDEKIFFTNESKSQGSCQLPKSPLHQSKSVPLSFQSKQWVSDVINYWSAKVTNHRVTGVIESAELDNETEILAVSIASFHDEWADDFITVPFFIDDDDYENVVVAMLGQTVSRNGHLPELKARFAEIPCKGSDANGGISMFVVAPEEPDGYAELRKRFHRINLRDLLSHDRSLVEITMPQMALIVDTRVDASGDETFRTKLFGTAENDGKTASSCPARTVKLRRKALIDIAPNTIPKISGRSITSTNNTMKFVPPFILVISTTDKEPVILFLAQITAENLQQDETGGGSGAGDDEDYF